MTIMTRKLNKIITLAGILVVTAAISGNAQAEDTHAGYGVTQPQYKAQSRNQHDQQYVIPHSYNGKYYPDEDTAIGYHGTSNTAQNTPQGNSTPYYYYY